MCLKGDCRKTGECLMDADGGYEVGDKIVLTSGTEDPLEDTLKTDTYTVVGLGSSPCYVSIERGSHNYRKRKA